MSTYTQDQLTQMARHVLVQLEAKDARATQLITAMCVRLRVGTGQVLRFLKWHANAPHPLDQANEFEQQFRQFFKDL